MSVKTVKGRGAISNSGSRFVSEQRHSCDDGWYHEDEPAPTTELRPDSSKTIISTNQSIDVPFEYSVNPYKGCEHGCSYCFARPTHAWLDLSPGLDFESKIFFRRDAAELLVKAFNRKNYHVSPIALGANTDPYQPVERKLGITRRILEVMLEYRHPVSIVTKSSLIVRDIDILVAMAKLSLVHVMISVTTQDRHLSRCMEPRASSPEKRYRTVQQLSSSGIPVGVLLAPVIPALNDHEIEGIVQRAAEAGAANAGMIMLRLPGEVRQIFIEWLENHYPEKAGRVLNLLRQCRNGELYDARPGLRMSGTGDYAQLLFQRFTMAVKRQGLKLGESTEPLSCSHFRTPAGAQKQFVF